MKTSPEKQTNVYIIQPIVDGYKTIGYGLFSLLNEIENTNNNYKACIIPLYVKLKNNNICVQGGVPDNKFLTLEDWSEKISEKAEVFLISINWYIHLYVGLEISKVLLKMQNKVVVGGLTASIFADDIAIIFEKSSKNFKVIKGPGERKIKAVLTKWGTESVVIEEKEDYSSFNTNFNYSLNDFGSKIWGWKKYLNRTSLGRSGYLGSREKMNFYSARTMQLYLGSGCCHKCKYCSSSMISKYFNLTKGFCARIHGNQISDKTKEDIKNYIDNDVGTFFLDFNPSLDVNIYFKVIKEIAESAAQQNKEMNLQINLWGQKNHYDRGVKLLELIKKFNVINKVELTFSFDDLYCNDTNGKKLNFEDQVTFLYNVLDFIRDENEQNTLQDRYHIELFLILDPFSHLEVNMSDEEIKNKIKKFINRTYRKYHSIFSIIDFVFMPLMLEPESDRSKEIIKEKCQFDWYYNLSKKVLSGVPFNQMEVKTDCIEDVIRGKSKDKWIRRFNLYYNFSKDLRWHTFRFKFISMYNDRSKVLIEKLSQIEKSTVSVSSEHIIKILKSTVGFLISEYNRFLNWEGVKISLATLFADFPAIKIDRAEFIKTHEQERITQIFEKVFPQLKLRDMIFYKNNYKQYKYIVNFGSGIDTLSIDDIPLGYDLYSTNNDNLIHIVEMLSESKDLKKITKKILDVIKTEPQTISEIKQNSSLVQDYFNNISKENVAEFQQGLKNFHSSDRAILNENMRDIMLLCNFLKNLTLKQKIVWFVPIGGFEKVKASFVLMIDFSALRNKEDILNFMERSGRVKLLRNVFEILSIVSEFDSKLQLVEQLRRIAIISILVDSFAHNIAAHSLAAMVWFLKQREQKSDDIIKRVKDKRYSGNIINELEGVSQHLKKITPQGKVIQLVSELKDSAENTDLKPTVDDILIHLRNVTTMEGSVSFAKYLCNKAAFWSGVTRDFECGGEIRSWYDVLKDFAKNSVYLGTIAHAEGIHKVRIKVGYGKEKDSDQKTEDFAVAKFDVIKQVSNTFIELYNGKGDEETSWEDLDTNEWKLFLPNGIVGLHALYTIFENTIRNIKHADPDELEKAKTEGIEFNIFIRSDDNKHFNTTIWLGNKSKIMEEKTDEKGNVVKVGVDERISYLLEKPIISDNGSPRMGGNSQDKICASMLYNNVFAKVDDQSNPKRHTWIHVERNPKSEEELGVIKRSFYVWKGQDKVEVVPDSNHADKPDIIKISDLKYENPARFKFVIVPKSEEKDLKVELAEKGIVRIMEKSECSGDDLDSLYKAWNKKWIKCEEIIIFAGQYPFIYFGVILENNGWIIKDITEYRDNLRFESNIIEENKNILDDQENPVLNIKENNIIKRIPWKHKGTKSSDCKTLEWRSHGVLFSKKFIPEPKPGRKLCFVVKNNQDEFIEALLTNIEIYDNRIYERVKTSGKNRPKTDLIDLYAEQLFLHINDEKMGKTEFIEKAKESKANFFIIHLSYIESMNFSEKDINEFIETCGMSLNYKTELVITTGRGRGEWHNCLDKRYKPHVLFKPIDSLLAAVEDGLILNDDFQVKYNLVKILFGS